MEKIKTVQIHNQTLNVHYCNRSNLLMLDAATGGNRAGTLILLTAWANKYSLNNMILIRIICLKPLVNFFGDIMITCTI